MLQRTHDVQGAYVQLFSSLGPAISAWRQAVHGNHSLYPDSTISQSPSDMDSDASSSDGSVLSISSVCLDDEWNTAKHHIGPKWVVWTGHLPGVLDSWYVLY